MRVEAAPHGEPAEARVLTQHRKQVVDNRGDGVVSAQAVIECSGEPLGCLSVGPLICSRAGGPSVVLQISARSRSAAAPLPRKLDPCWIARVRGSSRDRSSKTPPVWWV